MVIGAVTGIFGGKKAKKAAKKQKKLAQQVLKETELQTGLSKESFELERAAVAQQRRQDRIGTIREARIRRAMLLSAVSNAGVGQGSSAVAGGVGALQSQFASTLGLANIFTRIQDQSADLQSQINESQGRVAKLTGQSQIAQANLQKSQANLQMWGSIGQLGETLAVGTITKGEATSVSSPDFFRWASGGSNPPAAKG